jgi:Circularly permutated YpsA SLOG family
MSDEPAPRATIFGKISPTKSRKILAPYADPETWRWQLEEMEDSELKQLFSERLRRLEAERPSPEDAIKLMLAHGGDSSSEKAEKPPEKAGMGGYDAIGDAVRRASGPNPMRIMLAPMGYAETLATYGVYDKDLPPPNIQKVISGGQTGTDRAALDWAIESGIEHGGCCPQGRIAEDGVIPEALQSH